MAKMTSVGNNSYYYYSPRNSLLFRHVVLPIELACMQQTLCGMQTTIFFTHLYDQGMTTVWFISESGAVGSWQAKTYVGLPVSSSWLLSSCGRNEGYTTAFSIVLNIHLQRPFGIILPKRIYPGHLPPISERWRHNSSWACMQLTHCVAVMHASICSHIVDVQGSLQSGLCPSREQSVPAKPPHMWGYRSLPAVLKRLQALER